MRSQGGLPLHLAIWSHDINVLQLLIDYGADVNLRDYRRSSPLHLACRFPNQPGIAHLLLQNGAEVDAVDMEGLTPLYTVIELRNHIPLFDDGYLALLSTLFEYGASVSKMFKLNANTLRNALQEGSTDHSLTLLRRKNPKATLFLWIFLNLRAGYGASPLHLACLLKYDAVATTLIEKGADIRATDEGGASVLEYAAITAHYPVVEAIIRAGAVYPSRTRCGLTFLHRAARARRGDILEFFLEQAQEKELDEGIRPSDDSGLLSAISSSTLEWVTPSRLYVLIHLFNTEVIGGAPRNGEASEVGINQVFQFVERHPRLYSRVCQEFETQQSLPRDIALCIFAINQPTFIYLENDMLWQCEGDVTG